MNQIQAVTILGANGSMGIGVSGCIAAFLGVKVYMVSRSIEKSVISIEKAAKSVRADIIKSQFIPKSYDDLEECITSSQWVFETITENYDLKFKLYKRINPYLHGETIVTTGTSGLSISKLKTAFTTENQANFFGTHFFNPPYAMPLCEIIKTDASDPKIISEICDLLTQKMYRKTVVLKDLPAFVGNRVGFQVLNEALILANDYRSSGGIDYIDAILGSFTGRAMPPLTTVNFVGLDIHKAIVDNVYENTNDAFRKRFIFPGFANTLVSKGNLGVKSGKGLYYNVYENNTKTKYVYDIDANDYRVVKKYNIPFASDMCSLISISDYSKAFKILKETDTTEAYIAKHLLCSYIFYSILIAGEMEIELEDIDTVMCYGFNWMPVTALINLLGGCSEVVNLICNDKKISELYSRSDIHAMVNCYDKNSTIDFRRFIRAKR